jgi:hypothetical protein
MTNIDITQLDFSVGKPCPPNNPYCGNRDRHLHGSFACELRCPCRSGFSEEARVQAAKDWTYQRSADDYLRKLLSEHFGLNSNSPDYNDQLWISGLTPPVSAPENALRKLVWDHFGVQLEGPDYYHEIFNLGLPMCKDASEQQIKYDYIELNYAQIQVLVAIKYAIKSYNEYLSREGDIWKDNAARAAILRDSKMLEARQMGIPQAQIDRFLKTAD